MAHPSLQLRVRNHYHERYPGKCSIIRPGLLHADILSDPVDNICLPLMRSTNLPPKPMAMQIHRAIPSNPSPPIQMFHPRNSLKFCNHENSSSTLFHHDLNRPHGRALFEMRRPSRGHQSDHWKPPKLEILRNAPNLAIQEYPRACDRIFHGS